MAFDGVAQITTLSGSAQAAPEAWRRDERFALLIGAASFGAMAGFAATLWTGRLDTWLLPLIALPILALDLHLTGHTLTEALRRGARGCAGACALHAAAVFAWPVGALVTPAAPMAFWAAPLLALTALILFASCWTGPSGAIYRMSGQGALVAALTVQQAMFLVMGG